MKKILLILAIAAIFVSCEKQEPMNVNHYEYVGSRGNYTVKLQTVDLRTVHINQNYTFTETIGADDIFTPVFEFVSKEGNEPVTLTILKNGVIISEETY
jgi:hypothetical protein